MQGRDPRRLDALEAELTVAGLAEHFMRVHVGRHLKPATVTTYRSVLESHLLPAFGATAAGQLRGAEVTAFHYRLRDTPSMANMAVHLVCRMFTLAEAWDLVPPGRDPCRGLRRYRMRPRERFLKPAEDRDPGPLLGRRGPHGGRSEIKRRQGESLACVKLGSLLPHDLRHSFASTTLQDPAFHRYPNSS